MTRFEYLRIDLNNHHTKADEIDVLNQAGQAGWELVAVTANALAYLRRPLAEPEAPPRRRTTKPEAGTTTT